MSGASQHQMQLQRLRLHGVDTLFCRAAPVGRFTRLHVFMSIGLFPPGWAAAPMVDGYMNEAVQHSIRSKGGLPGGMQTGTATVGVILSDRVAPEVSAWARKQQRSQFAALGYPAVVELAQGRVVHPQRLIVGAVYSRVLREFVRTHVTEVLFPTH